MTLTQGDERWRVEIELAHLLGRLAVLLRLQRDRGRTAAADEVGGYVIEDGEAEGLIGELAVALATGASRPPVSGLSVGDTSGDDPLRIAIRAFELGEADYIALLIALAVETDSRFGRLIAYLNDHVGKTRPTVGLALALAALDPKAGVPSPAAFRERPVVRDGLLELEGEGPLPGLALRVPRDLLSRLSARGFQAPEVAGLTYHAAAAGRLDGLVLDDDQRRRLSAWAESATGPERGTRRALIVAGAPGSGRATAARAAAGRAVLAVACPAEPTPERLMVARRESRWYGGALLFRFAPSVAVAVDWPSFWEGVSRVEQPLMLALPEDAVDAAAASAPVEPALVSFPEPGSVLRARLWKALLPAVAEVSRDDIHQLSGRFRFGPGRIARAVRRAEAESRSSTAFEPLDTAALERACRGVGASGMSGLAQKLALPYTRGDLVVPEMLRVELDLAVTWVRRQSKVLDDWGFAGRVALGRGLTALFAGPPGTGKTMAAQVLARDLGLDLYRVDLSRVMSKWIGETEKHLSRLFDEAQASGAVLFFDEADALFGKRSEVKDAHDRYANVEIGYLLQRMEEYEGVTVLATNRKADLDDAFIRRFHFLLNFPPPDEEMRKKIWEGMFPAAAERDPNLDLTHLARDFEMSGGEIKNVVLAAAFLAAGDGRPIGMRHLGMAISREFRKGGKLVDERRISVG